MIDALFSSWFSPFSFFACCRNAGSVRHQRCGNILFIVYVAFIFLLCNQHGRIGETLTSWIVGLELSRFGILPGARLTIYGAGLPHRRPRHDRHHGAAALSNRASIRSGFGVMLVLLIEM